MKKMTAIVIAAVMIATLLSANVFATRGLVYTAPYGTPKIDGEIDAAWDAAEWTNVDLPYSADEDTYGGHALRVKVMWDENYLYFLGEMTCPDVDGDNCIMEVYIDELNNKGDGYDVDDTQIGFDKDGIIDSYGTNSRSYDIDESAGVVTDTGYRVEACLCFAEVTPVAGLEIGLEFMANVQVGGTFTQAFRWNADTAGGDAAPWQSTAPWGTLVLGAAASEEVVEETPVEETPVEETPVEETPVEEAPVEEAVDETPVTTAPSTSDYITVIAIVAVLALAGTVVCKKVTAK